MSITFKSTAMIQGTLVTIYRLWGPGRSLGRRAQQHLARNEPVQVYRNGRLVAEFEALQPLG